MTYNNYFELAAVIILIIVLYDFKNKMRIYKLDSILFKGVIYITLLECCANFSSSVLIQYHQVVPRNLNIVVAVLFFVLQASKLYALVLFSFAYMNPHFSMRDPLSYMGTALYVINVVLSVTTPFTRFYFYFDESNNYVQGFGSDLGYLFYLINVGLCLVYVLKHRSVLVMKDIRVAAMVAVFVGVGVVIQFCERSLLMIDFSVAIAVLYLYMTLENPNDYQDRLTHISNEYGFKIYMDRKCIQQREFSVLFLNIRKFRYVNSFFGMEMGDHMLQQVALFLEKTFSKQVVFRIHNDLFAVVMNGTQEKLGVYAQLIHERFTKEWMLPDGRGEVLDPMIVICEYPKYFQTHTELVKLKNEMLKKGKEKPDNHILFADRQFTKQFRRHDQVEQILKRALVERTLQVYYQPIVDSRTNQVVYLEALSRLWDDELGFIPPDEFIAIAEETGMIISLGYYVLDQACGFIAEKLLTNPNNQVQGVHVNISSLQCAYPKLMERFEEIIRSHTIPPAMIQFELTESTMLESPDMVRSTMNGLIAQGMQFALDDYGTGYSNISYLVRFPFEKIKFDKNLVWSYFENEEAHSIMQNEFELLMELKKEIVVEGIETEEQYIEMKAQGIHLFQGYYFSKPLPAAECALFLEKFGSR